MDGQEKARNTFEMTRKHENEERKQNTKTLVVTKNVAKWKEQKPKK